MIDPHYRRGFLLTTTPHDPPRPGWQQRDLPGVHLSHDHQLPYAFAGDGNRWVCLLGEVADLVTETGDIDAIAADLVAAIGTDRARFYEALDALAGRFLVVDGGRGNADNGIRVQTDATAARSAFHTHTGPRVAVSSHVDLLADQTGATADPTLADDVLRELSLTSLPGRATGYHGLVALVPNTELDLGSGEVRRVWPRGEPSQRSASDVAERVTPLLRWHAGHLLRAAPVYAQLSAGAPSRVVLALADALQAPLTLLTVERPGGVDQVDVEVARALAAMASLEHRVLKSEDPEADPADVVAALGNQEEAGRRLLRSDALGLGRAFFRRPWAQRQQFSEGILARAVGATPGEHPAVDDAFADYAQATDLSAAVDAGYKPFDLLAWEHRLGTAATRALLAQDDVVDPVPIGNARAVIEPLLSMSGENRQSGRALFHIIDRLAPELLRLPVDEAPDRRTDARHVRRSLLRETPELTAAPPLDEEAVPSQEHPDVEDIELEFAPGLSRHRIRLPANDPRGTQVAELFGDLALEARINERGGDVLLVVLHGAMNRSKTAYPHFSLPVHMSTFGQGSVLWLADPTVQLMRALSTGWYLGPAMTDVAQHCARTAESVAAQLGASRVVFLGWSSGGFGALSMSRYLPGSAAVAFSPHVDVAVGRRLGVNRLLDSAFPGIPSHEVFETFADRTDLTRAYSAPTENLVRVVQNSYDVDTMRNHLPRLTKALGLEPAGGSSADGSRSLVYDEWRGIYAVPPLALLWRHVEQAIDDLGAQR